MIGIFLFVTLMDDNMLMNTLIKEENPCTLSLLCLESLLMLHVYIIKAARPRVFNEKKPPKLTITKHGFLYLPAGTVLCVSLIYSKGAILG